MNILLVLPVTSRQIFEEYDPHNLFLKWYSRISAFRIPVTFPILAALTPEKHRVEMIEADFQDIEFEKTYDLVGITATTDHALLAYKIADEFRNRGVKVVLGGWHASALPEEAKQHADSVVVGEAEEIWPQLLNDMEHRNLKPFYIPKRSVDSKLIPRLRFVHTKSRRVGIHATRGCPTGCTFCSITNMKFRRIFRMRSIEDVIEEIKLHSGKLFVFQDPSLTANPSYAKDLFKALKGLNRRWVANGNINILGHDDELLKLANEAGCIDWSVGFESVNQESLNSVGKKAYKVKEFTAAIKKIHDYGMIVDASFVLGLDPDLPDVFEKTDEFVRKSEIDIPCSFVLIPYPGTPIFEQLDQEGRILTRDWSKYNQQNVVFQPRHMTPDELLINNQDLNKKWYTTMRGLERMIKSIRFGFYPFVEVTSSILFWKFSHLEYYRPSKASS
jgi:radical SAM superfamily enzyme YgiQ (UPF0313 family)